MIVQLTKPRGLRKCCVFLCVVFVYKRTWQFQNISLHCPARNRNLKINRRNLVFLDRMYNTCQVFESKANILSFHVLAKSNTHIIRDSRYSPSQGCHIYIYIYIYIFRYYMYIVRVCLRVCLYAYENNVY